MPMKSLNGSQQPLQLNVDPNSLEKLRCPNCMGDIFKSGFRLHKFSKIDPRNTTGQDVLVQVPILYCADCETVFGDPPRSLNPGEQE